MLRISILLICGSLLLFSCKSEPAEQTADTENTSAADNNTNSSTNDSAELSAVKKGLRSLLAGNMVESVSLNKGKLKVNYYKTAADFVANNEGSRMNDAMFKNYWTSGSRAEKVIILTPAQMLNSFSFVNSVDVTLHTGEETWSTSLTQNDLAKFTNMSWAALQQEWNDMLRGSVVRKPDERKRFIKEFVKIN